jgi:hypothetical protein
MISLKNLIPIPPWGKEYNNQLKLKMAKAAIKVVAHDAMAHFLISMTGLGESMREQADQEVKALFQPAKEIWRKHCRQAAELSPTEWYEEKDAFLLDDPSRSFFRNAVNELTEELTKEWAKKPEEETHT